MAFFGITALGPQNTFATVESGATFLHIFDENDYVAAWNKVNGSNTLVCSASLIEAMLKVIYRGPIAAADRQRLAQTFSEYQESITKAAFIDSMTKLRNEAESALRQPNHGSKPSREFTSNKEYQQCVVNHKAFKYSLQEKQSMPLTASQEVRDSHFTNRHLHHLTSL